MSVERLTFVQQKIQLDFEFCLNLEFSCSNDAKLAKNYIPLKHLFRYKREIGKATYNNLSPAGYNLIKLLGAYLGA